MYKGQTFTILAFIFHITTLLFDDCNGNKIMAKDIKNIDEPLDHTAEERMSNGAYSLPELENDMKQVNPKQIMKHLEFLTKVPHLSSTKGDNRAVEYIECKWIEYGLDVSVKTYELLLDFPNKTHPNKVYLYENGKQIFESQHREKFLDKQGQSKEFVDAFVAYSKAGTVTGRLAYVNFGRKEDFDFLNNKSSKYYTDLKGAICMARLGKIYRGNMVKNAGDNGCVGVILFTDPSQVAPGGANNTYPKNWWLPGSGMERGSLLLVDGDPETPNYPSIEGVYRHKYVKDFVPTQPIGYDDAKVLLSKMGGLEVPEDWRGGIKGVIYRLGDSKSAYEAKLVIRNKEKLSKVDNVIGVIKGNIEPDRYVLYGNHRDAWGYGAVDPTSGTAQMMEVTRILGEKMQTGWRPRRTMMFFSWGAEEYSLGGSREFVEEFKNVLSDRSVAYLNIDSCSCGQIPAIEAAPVIQNIILQAYKDIPDPMNESRSYYDFWEEHLEKTDGSKPEVWLPSGSSDHSPFLFYAGVPSTDIYALLYDKDYPNIDWYPTYHTGFETYDLVEKYMDPGAKYMSACAKLSLRLLWEFSQSVKLNYDPTAVTRVLKNTMEEFKSNKVMEYLGNYKISTAYITSAIEKFSKAADRWKQNGANNDATGNCMQARFENDQGMKLGQSFLSDSGVPHRKLMKNILLTPSQFDSYGGGSLAGISDMIYLIEKEENELQKEKLIEELRMHVTEIQVAINSATNVLLGPGEDIF